MLFDFNEALPRAAERQYDVCICGTGPAGITTARKLATAGKRVLLLEGGGLSYTTESQDHYKGTSIGLPLWLEYHRLRYFGGTSNHWSGLCALIQPYAFRNDDRHELPGWPIPREEVLTYLEDAKDILDISGKDLNQSPQPGFPSPWFERYAAAYSAPTRFFEKYGDEIRQSPHIDAFYNANLVDVTLSADSARVKHLQVQNYNGATSDLSAAQYVLALGAIENARILLNANHQIPSGIGNHSGMVGRCFMESLNAPIGRFLVTDQGFWHRNKEVPLVPTEALMRQKQVDDGVIDFTSDIAASDEALKSYGRLRVLKEFLHETGCLTPAITRLARRLTDFDCPGDGLITTLIEQEPNLNSRITLTSDVDSFGLRRIQMNWQIKDNDRNAIRVLALESAKEMARLDRARVQLAPFIFDPDREIPIHGHGHHMGTTRMSADSRYGVVDQNCRVHGIDNLYLTGSSVFPRCGGRNPTITIVLLALRLGAFLSRVS
jgi:choline dehydrogenase-like flavoprotein